MGFGFSNNFKMRRSISRLGLRWMGVVFLVKGTMGQKDPLNDFCRRFGHQTTVVDQKLYVDGGLVDYNPISQNPNNYSNTWLLYNDLTTSPSGISMPQLHANLSKNSSIPSVSGAILWPDTINKRFYLYGGDYYGISPNSPSLLSYDILYNQWESFPSPTSGIQSVSWGAGVGISELGQGYILGGYLSNSSIPGWAGDALATSTLVKYEMDEGVWTNNTGPDTVPRAEGEMVYIPASDNGLLVYFGGVKFPFGNETMVQEEMTNIYIYDVKSSKWYTQTAVGDVPGARRRFCAGVAWAEDRSSYNIYLYGGLGFGANSTGYDDVYILSLPTFTWIKWWQGSGTGKPHHSLSCNIVNSAQMIIIGGSFPLSSDCDSPSTWGTHNLDLGKQSGKIWNDYLTNLTSYVVPPEVVSVVGGASTGGATATVPAAGFLNADLLVYFSSRATIIARTPTRSIPTATSSSNSTASSTSTPSSSKKLGTGPIVGIAVGSAAVLIGLFIIACLLNRHRSKNRNSNLTDGTGGLTLTGGPMNNNITTYSTVPAYSIQGSPGSPYTASTPGGGTSAGGYSPEMGVVEYPVMSPMGGRGGGQNGPVELSAGGDERLDGVKEGLEYVGNGAGWVASNRQRSPPPVMATPMMGMVGGGHERTSSRGSSPTISPHLSRFGNLGGQGGGNEVVSPLGQGEGRVPIVFVQQGGVGAGGRDVPAPAYERIGSPRRRAGTGGTSGTGGGGSRGRDDGGMF